MSKIEATEDGTGLLCHCGGPRAFVSSMHLVPDKEAQLNRILNEQDQ